MKRIVHCLLSRGSTDHALEMLSVAAAKSVRRAALQYNAIFAASPRLQFADTIHVDDCRPVNTNEDLRVNLRLNVIKSVAQEMCGVTNFKANIVAFRFN